MIPSDDDTIVVDGDAVSIKNWEELDPIITNEDDEDCSAEVETSNIKKDDADDDDKIVYDSITDSEGLATVDEEYIDVEG